MEGARSGGGNKRLVLKDSCAKLQVGGKGLPRYYWRTAYINTHTHILTSTMWPLIAKHSLTTTKAPSDKDNTFKHEIWEGGCGLKSVWGDVGVASVLFLVNFFDHCNIYLNLQSTLLYVIFHCWFWDFRPGRAKRKYLLHFNTIWQAMAVQKWSV